MKFRYTITYAKLQAGIDGVDAVKKAFDDHVKWAEKHELKVPFWGSPWGSSENIVIVYGFDDISKYEKFMEIDRKLPYSDGRTTLVLKW